MNKVSYYLLVIALLSEHRVLSQKNQLTDKFDQYVRPYVETQNFSGSILISKKGEILFQKAYGFANLEFKVPNDLNTTFHVASLSRTFTAAAILLLEQKGLLTTGDFLSKYISDYPSGDKITIHHLLSHTSGIKNVNDLAEYENSSHQHQTPESLIAMFKNKPLEFQPGEKYEYSNSNYNLLAFIIEQVSKMKYGDFLWANIFKPLGMESTLHHDNMNKIINKNSQGYSPDGNFGLQKSPYLDWSSKTGNGSIATTANDLEKWNKALLGTSVLSDKSKTKMFTKYAESGYGWYLKKLYDKNYIYMNRRSPGFCAYIGRYPEEEICVIVLSNIYVSVPSQIAVDLASILFNQPMEMPAFNNSKITSEESRQLVGKYQFGKDFYRPNFILEVSEHDGNLFTSWGELIPNKPFHYIQRTYWSKIIFNKDTAGKINGMVFDHYIGDKVE